MRRSLLSLLLAAALLAGVPAAAHAGWVAGEPLDGPSADIVGVEDLDIARDGSGAVVWRRRVDGVPHVFVSRLFGGLWHPPQRVDGPIPEGADEASVAAADGGRVAVFWVSGARVLGVQAPAGPTLQPLSGPVLLHQSPDGVPSGGLDAEMGVNGTAFAVWRASGGGGADVRAARLKGAAFTLLASPVDITPANAAGAGTGRPRVAVDAAGTGLATWGEANHVFARRLLGTRLSRYPQDASVAGLGAADLPEVDVEEDGSFAWVVFRQFDPGGARAIARRLVGLSFEPAAAVDAGPGAGPPILSINGSGQGAALVPAAGGSLLIADIAAGNRFVGPGRLDTQGGAAEAEAALFSSDRRQLAAAWRRDAGGGNGTVLGRYRWPGQAWEPEAGLSRPEFGPVAPGSVHVSGSRNGDTAVAMLQGTAVDGRVVVASYDLPPGRPYPEYGWVREAQPVLRWSGGADLWGLQGFQVLVDGAVVGGTTGSAAFRTPAPLADGDHTVQVVAVDRRGQQTPSRVRRVRVDTVPPTATLRVTGRRRARRALTVSVTAADTGSGVGAISVDYGDRTRRGREAVTRHRWTRRGRYRVTARVADVAGHVTTARVTVRIRRR